MSEVSTTRSAENVSVIIIGAGASGIAAATKLLENGIEDIVILEAESRIGGRIHSVQAGNIFVDLGAHYCMGEEGNIVHQLSKDFNILKRTPINTESYHSSKGRLEEDIANLTEQLFFDCYEYDKSRRNEFKDKNVGHHCMEKITTAMKGLPEIDNKIKKSIPRFIEKCICSNEAAFDWNNVAVVDNFEDHEGYQYLNWNGLGYKTILEIMMKKYPDSSNQLNFDEKLKLNKEVKRILWKNNSTVSVECSDGTQYLANHVIFTPSVGVLKHNYQNIFLPHLPEEKVKIVESLGFDATMVVVFYFPTRWWLEKGDIHQKFDLFWDEDDVKKLATEFPRGPMNGRKHWLEELAVFITAAGHPNALEGWFGGEMIPEIEKLQDETLIDGAYFLMKKFLDGKYDVVKPDKVFRMNWHGNPHFHGTYSYQTPKSLQESESPQETLQEPLVNDEGEPIVLFAGEATNPIHYGTVHGAIESGYREAERLLKYNRIQS